METLKVPKKCSNVYQIYKHTVKKVECFLIYENITMYKDMG